MKAVPEQRRIGIGPQGSPQIARGRGPPRSPYQTREQLVRLRAVEVRSSYEPSVDPYLESAETAYLQPAPFITIRTALDLFAGPRKRKRSQGDAFGHPEGGRESARQRQRGCPLEGDGDHPEDAIVCPQWQAIPRPTQTSRLETGAGPTATRPPYLDLAAVPRWAWGLVRGPGFRFRRVLARSDPLIQPHADVVGEGEGAQTLPQLPDRVIARVTPRGSPRAGSSRFDGRGEGKTREKGGAGRWSTGRRSPLRREEDAPADFFTADYRDTHGARVTEGFDARAQKLTLGVQGGGGYHRASVQNDAGKAFSRGKPIALKKRLGIRPVVGNQNHLPVAGHGEKQLGHVGCGPRPEAREDRLRAIESSAPVKEQRNLAHEREIGHAQGTRIARKTRGLANHHSERSRHQPGRAWLEHRHTASSPKDQTYGERLPGGGARRPPHGRRSNRRIRAGPGSRHHRR